MLSQVDAAWERARDLREAGVELHFEIDELFGGASAVLRTRDGSVSERLSAREALTASCGIRCCHVALRDRAARLALYGLPDPS